MATAGGLMAAFFVFQEDFETAFVAAAGGAVCWFLNYRQKLRESMPKEEDEEQQEDEEVHS